MPVITDHDGPGGKPYTLFESGAILLYLAEKTAQFLPKDAVAKFDAIQWMMQMTPVGPMFGQYVHFMRFAPKGNDYALDRYRTQVRRVLATLEERLGVAPFLGGAELLDRRLSLGRAGWAHFSASPPRTPKTASSAAAATPRSERPGFRQGSVTRRPSRHDT